MMQNKHLLKKPREATTITFMTSEESVNTEVVKFIEREHQNLRGKGRVPIVGSEDVQVGDHDDLKMVTLTVEYLVWPEGARLLKYITDDGYVEWINTPHSK